MVDNKKSYIHFITGGQRSGKSSYAQKLALELSDNPVYMATSRIWDEGHKERIKRHQSDRGKEWSNIEEEKELSKHNLSGRIVLIDCVTLWLTNYFFDNDSNIDKSLEEAKMEFLKLLESDAHFIIISNEIGMGGHPTDELQMKFTDLQGWMNQFIASYADKVTLMVSGIPMKVR